MKKIFISGAAGFIGSHLSEFLYKKFTHTNFILLDKLTYASNKQYLKSILKKILLKVYLFQFV